MHFNVRLNILGVEDEAGMNKLALLRVLHKGDPVPTDLSDDNV